MQILQGKELGHRKCKEVTKTDLEAVVKQSDELRQYIDENNGKFDHQHFPKAYALHACQVFEDDQPFNFFVLDKELIEKPKKPDEDQKKMTDENYYFPDQVIVNPRVITSLKTYIDTVDRVQKGTGRVIGSDRKAVGNVVRVPEACMSYKFRDAKPIDRFYYITVKYQTIKKTMTGYKLVDHEEKIHGLKSHIFQHEIDHANGVDIAHGDGEKKYEIEDRVMENGVTLEEWEKHQEAWVEKIKEKNEYAIVERVDDGVLHRLKLDEVIPDGFAEGGLHYYEEDGTMKKEYTDLPIVEGEKYQEQNEEGKENTQTPEEETKA